MAKPIVGQPPPSSLAECQVLKADLSKVYLGDCWAQGPTLLLFLRHFGCMGCSQHVNELTPRLLELHNLGLKTIFIGNGEPRYMAGFMDRHTLHDKKVEILTDPSLRAFAAMGLERSWWATLGPLALFGFVRAFFAGHRQTWVEGDSRQQGGTLLVDDKGQVVYYYRNKNLYDRAATDEVVDIATRVLRIQKGNASSRDSLNSI